MENWREFDPVIKAFRETEGRYAIKIRMIDGWEYCPPNPHSHVNPKFQDCQNNTKI